MEQGRQRTHDGQGITLRWWVWSDGRRYGRWAPSLEDVAERFTRRTGQPVDRVEPAPFADVEPW